MANLSYGSKGSEVKKLQEELNKQGYKLDVDGIYGNKTQSAVRDYQSKNGLSVDGIAGVQTTGALYKAPANAVTPQTTQTAAQAAVKPTYTQSSDIAAAKNAVKDWEASKPQEYKGLYQEQIDLLLDKILNGEKFSYDVNADELYKQYKDQYVRLGQNASEDTLGQAAALTGGYGSSYGVTAGGQAYQAYLNGLLDKIPELENTAYGKYVDEQNKEQNRLSLLMGMDKNDYSRYKDSVMDYWSEGDYLWDKLSYMSDDEWTKFVHSISQYNSDRDYKFNQDKFDYQKTQDALAQENWQKQYALSEAAAKRTGVTGSASYSSSSSTPKDYNEKVEKQKQRIEMLKAFEKGLYKYPDNYADFVMLTGYSGVLTPEEFRKRKSYRDAYEDYSEYLIEMFNKYYLT